jgi:hypothetical protein
MRRDDLLALAEENRWLRAEVARLEAELSEARQEEVKSLQRRLRYLEGRLEGQRGPAGPSPRGVLSAVLLSAGLSLGLVGAMTALFLQDPPRPSAAHTSFAAEQGRLVVTGDPFDATIRVDGKILGKAPLFTEIPSGHHDLEILREDGEIADRMEFFARPGEVTRATYHLPPTIRVKLEDSPLRALDLREGATIHFIDHFVEVE